MKKGILSIILLVLVTASYFTFDAYRFLTSPMQSATPSQEITYSVLPGQSVARIAADLYSTGVLKRTPYFIWFSRINGSALKIKAGEYKFASTATPQQLLAQLVAGKVTSYKFTIVEGLRVVDLLEKLADNPHVVHKLKMNTPLNQQLTGQLAFSKMNLEGLFLPDTYHFRKGDSDISILLRSNAALAALLDSEWPKREQDLPLKTPYDALILASIVERETAVAEERSRIAGVFVLRLNKGIRLQTDPSVIYGLGDKFDGNIRRKDLRRDTPYNTYTRNGLPPTPISLSGASAIRSVLHPNITGELYFVAKGKEGRHQFSKTLKAHNQAVREYQLKK